VGIGRALIVVMVTLGIDLDNKIGVVQKDSQGLVIRLKSVEDSVKVLGSQQTNQIQKLIESLLAAAKTSGPEIAIRAVKSAEALTASLKKDKVPPSNDFFHLATEQIKELRTHQDVGELKAVTYQMQKQLAQYRSALQIAKKIGGTVLNCTPDFNAKNAMSIKTGLTVDGVTISNCPQSLDGITWKNIVFVNSRIRYEGGPLALENVTFVNCTFQTTQNNEGIKLLRYAALDKNYLKVPG
jgi:hypothetical protein